MKALVVFDGRFNNNDGKACSHHLTYDLFTTRYLKEFESVTVVGRLFKEPDYSAKPVTGPNGYFKPIEGYVGPKEFLKTIPSTIKTLWRLDTENTVVFLRTPGTIPLIYSLLLILKNKEFAVEVVADPYDQLGKDSVEHPIRAFFQHLYTKLLKWQCRKASGASYVTEYSLQKRYPPTTKITSHYTSLNLLPNWYRESARKFEKKEIYTLINVGMMNQLYKAQDVLLETVKKLLDRGYSVHLNLIGDGEYRKRLEELAEELCVIERVSFLGKISDRQQIIKLLDLSDIFTLPSRQEGLPRAMIEAMSRALPCVGTNVGGIPELIDEKFIVETNDSDSLAEKIALLIENKSEYEKQSQNNLTKSMEYRSDIVQARRQEFYRKLIELERKHG